MFEMIGMCEGPGGVVGLLWREKRKRLMRTQTQRENMMKKQDSMSALASVWLACSCFDDE